MKHLNKAVKNHRLINLKFCSVSKRKTYIPIHITNGPSFIHFTFQISSI